MNTKRTLPTLGVALLALGAAGLGGCNKIDKAEYDAAVQENNELRDRVATLQDTVRRANEQNSALQGSNQALTQENQRLSGMLESERERSVSGFENIPGLAVTQGPGGSIVLTVAGDVLFASGQIQLKADAKRTLDRVAQVIQSQYGGNLVRIDGHTDSDPIRKSKWKSNEHLAAERALAVEQYLVGKGVDNNRVFSTSWGPSNPRATKKDSRRVEIIVLAGAG